MTTKPAASATAVKLGSDPSPKGAGSDPNFTGRTSHSVSHVPSGRVPRCHAGPDPASMPSIRYVFSNCLRRKQPSYRLFSCSSEGVSAYEWVGLETKTGEFGART